MDKKKILAGAGILGIGLAYLLTRKKEVPSPPTYTCPYCGETFATLEELLAHIEAEHQGTPPPSFGRIAGRVIDGITGKGIPDAVIYVDSRYDSVSYSGGSFQTNYYGFGTYTVTVGASNYQTAQFDVTIDAEEVAVDFQLSPVPASGGWSEGVTIRSIKIEPNLLYLGSPVKITVYIDYPLPVPETIHATISIDGTELSGDFPTIYARVAFEYTPIETGVFTVVAKDKSANFEVLPSVLSTYYIPWGGVRMPICTDIIIPDVEPFELYGVSYPGGDIRYSEFSFVDIPPSDMARAVFRVSSRYDKIAAKLPLAYPVAWDMSDAGITEWTGHIAEDYHGKVLTIMPTNYTCNEYWDDKDELASVIAGGLGSGRWPLLSEWVSEYGKACPVCNGTGQVVCTHDMHGCMPGRLIECRNCGGTGKVLLVDLQRGWRDWQKAIDYHSVCGAGSCTPSVRCPYCDQKIYGPSHTRGLSWDKESFARVILRHIEEKHPTHSLTEPAWF